MKVSYALILLAGGFLSSGYHKLPNEASSLFFIAGIAALIAGAAASTEGL